MKSWLKGGLWGVGIIFVIWLILNILAVIEIFTRVNTSDMAGAGFIFLAIYGIIAIPIGFIIGAIIGLIVGMIRNK